MTSPFTALVKADLIGFSRSRIALFWTVAFPLLVLVAYMHLFAGAHLGRVTMVFEDRDGSAVSRDLQASVKGILRQQNVVEMNFADRRSSEPTERQVVVRIPERFGDTTVAGHARPIVAAATDDGDPATTATLGILRSALTAWNLAATGQPARATLSLTALNGARGRAHRGVDYVVAGLIVMIALSSSQMGFAVPLTAAREYGMTRQQSLWPMRRGAILAAWASSKFLIILGSSASICLVAWRFYGFGEDLSLAGGLAAIAIMALATLSLLAVGLAIAARVTSTQSALVIANMVYFVGLFTGDLLIPTGSLPALLKQVLMVSPINSFAHALRAALAITPSDPAPYAVFAWPVSVLSIIGLSAFVFAVRHYRWANR